MLACLLSPALWPFQVIPPSSAVNCVILTYDVEGVRVSSKELREVIHLLRAPCVETCTHNSCFHYHDMSLVMESICPMPSAGSDWDHSELHWKSAGKSLGPVSPVVGGDNGGHLAL